MNNLIKLYIDSLTKSKIEKFANENNIKLNEEEINLLYDTIKNNYELLINNDQLVFNKLEGKISNESLYKIRELFILYKKRYKNYL